MKRQSVEVKVKQLIRYSHCDEWEVEELSCEGIYTELRSYRKLEYQDAMQRNVSLKWANDAQIDHLEIRMPEYTLQFKHQLTTQTPYMTPQGLWLLDVHTNQLAYQASSDYVSLDIAYQLSVPQGPLGEYQFQLQFNH